MQRVLRVGMAVAVAGVLVAVAMPAWGQDDPHFNRVTTQRHEVTGGMLPADGALPDGTYGEAIGSVTPAGQGRPGHTASSARIAGKSAIPDAGASIFGPGPHDASHLLPGSTSRPGPQPKPRSPATETAARRVPAAGHGRHGPGDARAPSLPGTASAMNHNGYHT